MLTALKGKEETISIIRSAPSVLVTSCTVYNPSDGSEATTAVIANDETGTTISTSAEYRAQEITASGLSSKTQYFVTDTTGKTLTIHVIGVVGTTCTLRDPLPFGLNSGATVEGIQATAVFTVPSAYDQNSVTIDWLMDDGNLFPDELITSKYRFFNPVNSDSLYARWSRVKNNEPSYQSSQGLEWQPQIDRAVDMIRDKFWRDKYVLDRIRSPQTVSELIIMQTGIILVNMGQDLSASTDASETRKDLESQLRGAYMEVMGATNIWRDENEDATKQASELNPMGRTLVF